MAASTKPRSILHMQALMVAVLVTSAGCADRPNLVPVTGKVTVKGQPVTAGSVALHPGEGNAHQKDNPSSLLQTDGAFTFKTYPYGEGVPPGRYTMTLDPALAGRLKMAQYARPDTSPWKLDVPAGGLRDLKMEVR